MGIWEKLRGGRQEGGDIWDAPPRKGRNRAPAWQDMGEGDIWDAPPRRQGQEAAPELPDSWWEREQAEDRREEKKEARRLKKEKAADRREDRQAADAPSWWEREQADHRRQEEEEERLRQAEEAQAGPEETGQTRQEPPDDPAQREEARRDLEKRIRQVVDLAIQDYMGLQVGRYCGYITYRMEEWEKLCDRPGKQALVAELRILAGTLCRRDGKNSREKGRELAQFLDERYGNEPAQPPETLPGPGQAEAILADDPRNGWAYAVIFTQGENWKAPPYCPCCGRALTREELTPSAPPLSAREQVLQRIPLCRDCKDHEEEWPRREWQNLTEIILAGAGAGGAFLGLGILLTAKAWAAGVMLAFVGALLPGILCPLGYREYSLWQDRNPPPGHAARQGAVTVGTLSPERIGIKLTFARRGYARLFSLYNGAHQPAGVDPPEPDREEKKKISFWAGLGISLLYLIWIGQVL